jgi:hypothetical protein
VVGGAIARLDGGSSVGVIRELMNAPIEPQRLIFVSSK